MIGDVLLCNWDTPFAKLVRLYNKLHYGDWGWSHVSIIGNQTNNSYTVYEALGKGFIKSEYPIVWVNNQIKLGRIKQGTPNQPLSNVQKIAESYIGNSYDWMDIITLTFSLFTPIHNAPDRVKSVICSEAVAKILYDSSSHSIDFVKEFGKPYPLITPQDIAISKQIIYQ